MATDELDSLSDETFRDLPQLRAAARACTAPLAVFLEADEAWRKDCEQMLVWMMVVAGDFRRMGFDTAGHGAQQLRQLIEDTLIVTDIGPRGALGILNSVLESAEPAVVEFGENPFRAYASAVEEMTPDLPPARLAAAVGRSFALLGFCQAMLVRAALQAPR